MEEETIFHGCVKRTVKAKRWEVFTETSGVNIIYWSSTKSLGMESTNKHASQTSGKHHFEWIEFCGLVKSQNIWFLLKSKRIKAIIMNLGGNCDQFWYFREPRKIGGPIVIKLTLNAAAEIVAALSTGRRFCTDATQVAKLCLGSWYMNRGMATLIVFQQNPGLPVNWNNRLMGRSWVPVKI